MNKPLLTVQDALDFVLSHAPISPTQLVPLTSAQGMILREPLFADRDQPPFDRATMDGIALSSDAWNRGVRAFTIEGIQAAGEPQKILTHPETGCLRVMTGAMIPAGCDGIIANEQVEFSETTATVHSPATCSAGQYVHHKGTDRKADEILLDAGMALTPPRLAIAASGGHEHVTVSLPPRATVISTGDELVPLGQPVEPYQIRPSNAIALAASLAVLGCPDVAVRHLADQFDEVVSGLNDAVTTSDLVLISGGVSQGMFDHVPRALQTIGVKQIFHRVAQKPGKPLWFGVHPSGATVFGLPGNPVSTLVCFHRYVRPWLRRTLGAGPEPIQSAKLTDATPGSPPLTAFLPAQLCYRPDGQCEATALPYHGSGDLASLAESHGFIEIEASASPAAAGQPVRFFPWS